jgi:SAM-dependent methyltransferase
MGCGSGNTANEMAETSYQSYLGVDISEEALAKAAKRSKENGRQDRNRFECADIMHYVPTGQFNVILFRESMYHVPINKIKATLDRYAAFLKDNGVLIVRLFASNRAVAQSEDKPRPAAMLRLMESEFDVVERGQYDAIPGRPTVLVLRPRKKLAN